MTGEYSRFPRERTVLPADVAARVAAQEKAGRLVFEVEPAAVETAAGHPSLVPHREPEHTAPLPTGLSSDSYVQHGKPTVPTVVR